MLRVFVPGPFDRGLVVAAVRDGSLRRLRALVGTHGPLAVRLEDGGRAAIHLAAAAGDAVVVGYLLGLGADPGAATADGETPVHVAASEGHTAVVVDP
ncbi:MAG: ankyrin repeat domain-containing protein, partial [Myxococcota bacterium]